MKKAAVIGNPIEHSRSPLIHNHWLKKGNIEGSYEAIKAEDENDFENVVDRLVKEGYKGFNVTVPFKEKAYQMIDTAIDSVYFPNVSQSINTVVIEKNKLIGINTDYYGFMEGFAMQHPKNHFNTTNPERFDLNFAFPEIKNVVLLGAGGTARIIAGGLVDVSNFIYEPNCTLTILNRDENRAKNLCAELERIMLKHDTPEDGVVINYGPLNEFNQVIKNCDLLINCTTMGMQGGAQTPDFSFRGARSNLIFYDLVYTPLTTPLHRKAQKSQLLTMGGLGMLINQAVPAFILFYEDDYRNNLEPYEYVKVLYTQGLREFGRDPELWEILKKDISEK